MGRIKNSVAVGVSATAIAHGYFEGSTPVVLISGLGAAALTYIAKPAWNFCVWGVNRLNDLRKTTLAKITDMHPKEKAKAGLWAVSPTNDSSNAFLGTAAGLLGATLSKDIVASYIPHPAGQVAAELGIVAVGTATGLFFSDQKIKRGLHSFANLIDPTPLAPRPPAGKRPSRSAASASEDAAPPPSAAEETSADNSAVTTAPGLRKRFANLFR